MLRNWIIFFALVSLALFFLSCVSKPIATEFDGKWEFIDQPGVPTRVCLGEEDVAKLREILIRCERAQNP